MDGLIEQANMANIPYQLILYLFEYIYPKERRNKQLFLDMVLERFYAYQVEHGSFEIKTLVLVDTEDLDDVYKAFKYYASGDYLLKDEYYVMRTYPNKYKPIVERFMLPNRPTILVTDKYPFANGSSNPNTVAPLILHLKKRTNVNDYHKLFVANVPNEEKVTIIDFTLSINKYKLPDLNFVKERVIQKDAIDKEVI